VSYIRRKVTAVSIFASYFWLWSIVGLLGIIFLYTLGALMSFGGFVSPLTRVGRAVDRAPGLVKAGIVIAIIGVVIYPSLVHKLWADATAGQVRRTFEALPAFPGARGAPVIEQMNGLYDPTGTDGTYVIGWYGTSASFDEVTRHYERVLAERAWVRQPGESTGAGRDRASATRLQFRDNQEAARANYELLLVQLPTGSQEAPQIIASDPTVFALRLGVVDPRLTTQVAWFIDCLVRRAPTFPTCEAMGWHPLETTLDPANRPPGARDRLLQ
jgi:hypothetical protein